MPKKGDLSDCRNWRVIQLLSLPSKVYTRLILQRIRKAVDAKLREEKVVFWEGRMQSPLYVSFVDFKKAFDMVNRTTNDDDDDDDCYY